MRVLHFIARGAAVLFAFMAASNLTAAEPLQLTVDGRPNATIVLAENPRAPAQVAAFELQHYLKKISGAELPIVREPAAVEGNRILVGEGEATRKLGFKQEDLGEQEYVVKTLPDVLMLMGYDSDIHSEVDYASYMSIYEAVTDKIATCYAVHDFLERTLGVRWYYPNEEIGEIIPDLPSVAVKDLDLRRRPDAAIRQNYPLFSNTEVLTFTDWDRPETFQTTWVNSRTSLLYWVRLKYWGGMRYNANHSFHGYDKALGESHPEWFSTKNYDRMKQLGYQYSVQHCFSSTSFLDQVVEIARDYFDGKPEPFPSAYHAASGNFFPVVPNDNQNMCGCSTCVPLYRNDVGLGGDASHYVWGFVNQVAREVHKTHPDAMVSGIAYFNYTLPPTGLVFEPNVSVTFCKFYQGYHDPAYRERDYRRIEEYVEKNKARFFTTYEYPCKPFMDEWPFPCMVPRVHAEDVRRLRRIGGYMGGVLDRTVAATYSGTTRAGIAYANPVLDFMNVYWRVKLFDEYELDIEKGLAEYYELFFGPAAAGMNRFYTALEDRWMSLGGGDTARAWWGKLGTAEFLEEVAGYLEQARLATEEGSLYRKRVELVDAGIMQHLVKGRARYEDSALSEFAPIGTAAVAHTTVSDGVDWADDATWADALPLEISKTIKNEPVLQKTAFKLAHDGERLYILARCREPYVSNILAATRENDIGGFSDDSIELFVDPAGKGEDYYQFCINSLGTVYDARENPTAIAASSTITWNSGVEVKTAVGDDYWELRAALPFAAWKLVPAPGSTWRFNLCRNRYTEEGAPPYSGWSSTLGGFRNPERFGVITFNHAEDGGRLLWNCDFEGPAFAAESGESRLIGLDGWYENTVYANRGWDGSWKVVERDGNRFAVCDVNETCPSDIVPFHAVQVLPGVFSVEVDYRRHGLAGNQPTLSVVDANGKYLGTMIAWPDRGDLAAISQSKVDGGRRIYENEHHGLGGFAEVGNWFGMKLVVDTNQRQVTGYLRAGQGEWVRLNDRPLPYYDHDAKDDEIFLGFGSYRLQDGAGGVLDMDNVRVRQVEL